MTFLEKYEFLKKSVPVPSVMNRDSVECEYSEYLLQAKNCSYCFIGYKLEDSIYTTIGWGIKLVDCTSVTESEKCYKCINSNKCQNCTYLMDCNNCTDCDFSVFLNSCTDCFGCVGLTHKKYCIFNKQYTKVEYLKKVEELKKENPDMILEQMFRLKKQIPHPASEQANNENCPYGNYVYNSKNCYWIFNSYYCENAFYSQLDVNLRNCVDTFATDGAESTIEHCYELVYVAHSAFNCAFLNTSDNCTNCFYGAHLNNCSDCFGCAGLTKKKYCILNNQLTKDQYEKAVKEIKKELGWKY